MDSGIINAVSGWDQARPGTGYAGLRTLADRGFSGAVTDGGTWAFVLNGRIVGVFDGSIESFADADLTAHAAPDPSLPLLYAMQENGGETRARYYTNDTPLEQADSTLSSGNFTGYVELSENVLSGDYYVVYYGGRSMSVAFVGNSERLVTGEEAFELANDEVGIYEVNESAIEVVEIPDDESSTEETPAGGVAVQDAEEDAAATSDGSAGGADGGDEASTESASTPASESPAPSRGDPSAGESSRGDPSAGETSRGDPSAGEAFRGEADASDASSGPAPSDPGPGGDESVVEEAETGSSSRDESVTFEASEASERRQSRPEPSGTDGASDRSDPGQPAGDAMEAGKSGPVTAGGRGGDAGAGPNGSGGQETATDDAGDDVFSEEERWREAQSIPALDPSQTSDAGSERAAPRQSQSSGRGQASASRSATSAQSPGRGGTPEAVAELKRRLRAVAEERSALEAERDELVSERNQLEAEVDELEAHTDQLATERDEYRAEASRLQDRIEELEAEVDRLESSLEAAGATTEAERTMEPTEALEGTNLFIRYRTKSEETLEDAHLGNAERESVNENLRLEHHTSFEQEGLSVRGRPFESFLTQTIEYGFVKWVVRDLIYEIGATGNRNDLEHLYDAIPKIDRAELYGTVTLRYEDGGEEVRDQQTFDVVLRDRMGNPLAVANLNDSRRETTEDMMRSLIDATGRLRETSDSLGAAFYVTASFFDPGALEAASEATSGGLFSRSKHKSFVRVARKQGYHLCLVETRNGEFHVNVPEL